MRSHANRYPVAPRVFKVSTSATVVNGRASPYIGIRPGDIIELDAGTHVPLNIKNVIGTGMRRITIRNASGGQVVIDSASGWYGFWLQNCQHIHFTGTGSTDEYGVQVTRAQTNGIIFQNKTSYFEIDHCKFLRLDVPTANIGIQGQTNHTDAPDYDYNGDGSTDANDGVITRATHTDRFWHIHHCYFDGGAGTNYLDMAIYVGNSNWQDGTDTPEVEVVKIHDLYCTNIYHKTIQVGSAAIGLEIHHNTLIDCAVGGVYGVGEDPVGININPGGRCRVYSNWLQDVNGVGINFRGQSASIYNNVIIRPGDSGTYFDAGISCVPPVSTTEDINIFNNTIVDPAGNGVEFGSYADGACRVQNNIIVNPGDNYIDSATVDSYNYKTMTIADVDFTDSAGDDYSLTTDSPCKNAGTNLSSYGVLDDYRGLSRPQGVAYDQGAYEFDE